MAVGSPEGVVEETLREWQRTAESIVPLVDNVLTLAETSIGNIDFLALSSGPGSFTALRIGMATAKGLAYATGIPLVTVSTMEALAASACGHVDAPCLVPVIPARKREFYYASYFMQDDGLEEEEGIAYAPVDRLKTFLGSRRESCAVVARDVAPLEEVCRTVGMDAVKADFFTASALLPLAERNVAAGAVSSLETVTPDYQQKFRPGR